MGPLRRYLLLLLPLAFLLFFRTRTPRAPHDPRPTLMLAVNTPFAVLDLPHDSRPHAPDPPEVVPLVAWGQSRGAYVTRMPFRLRSFYSIRPSAGMVVRDASGAEIPHQSLALDASAPFWTYDADEIALWNLTEAPKGVTITYPRATEREAALNFAASGKSKEDFVRTSVVHGHETRTGLLLPAPATAAWDLTIPEDAFLSFTPMLVAPEIADGLRSDGATIDLLWTEGAQHTLLWSDRVISPQHSAVRVDLSAFAGHTGRLSVQTHPLESPIFDYVFLAEPVIAPSKTHPRRVILVFIDTLRPDHLGTYGYTRPTSPAIDALARRGVRFEHARSVAPWTLPSTRSLMTGRRPEVFASARTLPQLLAPHGFVTGLFAANMYLGASFDLDRGWGTHHIELLETADRQLDNALAWLDAHRDMDSLLLLHLMDMHLPYEEPEAYKKLFVSVPRPAGLPDDTFFRPHVMRAHLQTQEQYQYLRDRYDNNVRYVDDQLRRLWAKLTPSDLVVLFSDHGEEFWDHNGFEHGHSLYDELLHVPLIFAGGGAPTGGRVSEPVSLLDLVPTVLDLLGIQAPDGLDGISLLPLMQGDRSAISAANARPLAFGHPLYGPERWGVLDQQVKYTTSAGHEELYQLDADPGEHDNRIHAQPAAVDQLRERMAQGLDRPVKLALRLVNTRASRVDDPLEVALDVPGGIEAAWVGEDATSQSQARVEVSADRTRLRATWPAAWRGNREVFAVPVREMSEVSPHLTLTACSADQSVHLRTDASAPTSLAEPPSLLQGAVGLRGFMLTLALVPPPAQGDVAVDGFDDEVQNSLVAMGYAVDDRPDELPKNASGEVSAGSPCALEGAH